MNTVTEQSENSNAQVRDFFTHILKSSNSDDLLYKYGSVSRVLQSYRCICNDNANTPSFQCLLCRGTGYVYRPQANRLIVGERVTVEHDRKIETKYSPIQEIKKLYCLRNDHKELYDNSKITISSDKTYINFEGDYIPKAYDPVFIDYTYRRTISIVETIKSDGTTNIVVSCKDMNDKITHNKSGDIVKVNYIKNISENKTYNVLSFIKKSIFINDNLGIPSKDDVLEISYEYVPLVWIIGTNKTYNRMTHVWTNLESGKMLFIVPNWINISDGTVFCPLNVRVNRIDSMKRDDASDIDTLRALDVNEISDVIDPQATAKIYVQGVDYILTNYNQIKWISANKPLDNSTYSISFSYALTYKNFEEIPLFIDSKNVTMPRSIITKVFEFEKHISQINRSINTDKGI